MSSRILLQAFDKKTDGAITIGMSRESKRTMSPKAVVSIRHDNFEDLGVVVTPCAFGRPIKPKFQSLVFIHRWPTLAEYRRADLKTFVQEL